MLKHALLMPGVLEEIKNVCVWDFFIVIFMDINSLLNIYITLGKTLYMCTPLKALYISLIT